MNTRMILRTLGQILQIFAALLLLPLGVSLLYRESPLPLLIPLSGAALVGLLFSLLLPKTTAIYARDGFVIVGLGWILISPTLSGLLMGLGLAVVMLNVGLYFLNVETQVARQRLKDRPLVYSLTLDEDGARITNGQRTEPPVAIPWDRLLAAYAHRGDIYLYVNPERALILPEGQASVPTDALWGYLEKHLDKGKCVKL